MVALPSYWDRKYNGLLVNRKPLGPVEVDHSHPLARSIKHLWLLSEGAGTAFDLVGRNHGKLNAGNWSVTARGKSLYFPGSGDSLYCGAMADCRVEPLTVISGYDADNSYNNSTLCGTARQSTGAKGWVFSREQYNNSNKLGFTKSGVVGIASSFTSPTAYAVAGASVTTSQVIFGLDGATDIKASATSIVDHPSNKRFDIGGGYRDQSGISAHHKGNISFLMLFDEAKTTKDMAALTGDPLQILKPKVSRLYFPTLASAPAASKAWFFQTQILHKRRAA